MQKSGRAINPFDLNRDGVVTLPEMEEAVKRSFSNVKHDVSELKKVQEHGLQELNRIRKDLDEFVHRDDFTASGRQVQEFVRLLEKDLHEKEGKLLKHMTVLESRMSRLTALVMEGTELKARLASVEKQANDFQGVMDLSHLNRKLHDEILRISSDLLTLKHSVRGDLQEKVAGLEKQLAGLSDTDSNHLFTTRAELDSVAEELREQQSAHISRIDQQLSAFTEHFSAVEELLERREKVEADLGALREHLSAAGEFLRLEREALPARDEFMALNERVGRMERQLKQEIRKEVARELANLNINGLRGGVKKKARRFPIKKSGLKLGLKKEPGYFYFLDKNGNAARVRVAGKEKRAGRKPEVLVKCSIKRKTGHLYYIDKKGNVAFKKMARGRKKRAAAEEVGTDNIHS